MRPRALVLAVVNVALVAAWASPAPQERLCGPSAPAKSATPTAPDAVRARFEGFAGGPPFSLPEDLAGKPVVVNVWASWCTPCRKEMPTFQSVSIQARGTVGFLGVDYLDEAGCGPASGRRHGGDLPARRRSQGKPR